MMRNLSLWAATVVLLAATTEMAPAQEHNNPLDAVVAVKAAIRADAHTRETLGRHREGSGIVIDDAGLIVTIGFLVLEAESVDVVTRSGQLLPAEVLAYHSESGLGLLRAEERMDSRAATIGAAKKLAPGDQLLVAAFGGADAVKPIFVTDRRTFTGPWEYLLEDAIFTAPMHPNVQGAGLFDRNGLLVGVGYLTLAQEMPRGKILPGNMFVPVDVLMPVLADLISTGQPSGPSRPWLGMYLEEERGRLFVDRTADDGPADQAGITTGDILLTLDGRDVGSRENFFRTLWKDREAGDHIELKVLRGSEIRSVSVKSIARGNWYKTGRRSY
jgi:S1-C subfamily serine protease